MTSTSRRSLCLASPRLTRRSFVTLSVLAGVELPVLAGCKLPGSSKRQGSASSSPSTSGKAKASSTDWQELDGHIAGHHITVRVSPVIRKDETTSILALELSRASDDASSTENNKIRRLIHRGV